MVETSDKKLHCVVVTPETTVLDQAVDFVAVPAYDGELGILPGRAPLVARLGYGELRTRAGQKELQYYLDGGFLQVQGDVVSILTPRAIPSGSLDQAAARRALDEANAVVPTTPDAIEAKVISLSRARAQIRIAKRTSNV